MATEDTSREPPLADRQPWHVDYVCAACGADCGGAVGGPAFVVARETPDETMPAVAVLCARCWNRAVRELGLDEEYLEPATEPG